MRKLIILLAGITITVFSSGCATTSASEKDTTNAQAQQCNADNLQTFVGQKITSEITEQIRSESGSGTARVLRPNQPVTMDYRATRVNVHVDKDDVITMITCG